MAASSYSTPLSRVRGLGASHTGVGAFIAERVTSIALVPLCLWAVWATFATAPAGYAGAVALLHNPVQATLIVISFRHTELGMRVVIEDYIGGHGLKLSLILLNRTVALVGAALGAISILKVAFSAAAVS